MGEALGVKLPQGKAGQLVHVHPQRFPALRGLSTAAGRLTVLHPHPKIRELFLPFMLPHPAAWDLVAKDRFPSLKLVKIFRAYIRSPDWFMDFVRERARSAGCNIRYTPRGFVDTVKER